MMLRHVRSLPMLLACLLSGCASLGERGPPDAVYRLPDPAVTPPRGEAAARPLEALPVSLQLLRVTAAPELDGQRIVLESAAGRVDQVAAARWSGDLPRLVQQWLGPRLRDSGQFRQVGIDAATRGSTHLLAVHLRRCAAVYPGEPSARIAPQAVVIVDVTVSTVRDPQQLAGFTLQARVPASGAGQPQVIEALAAALAEVGDQLPARVAEVIRTSISRSTP
jgi:ABC-type uncharacterized transport system auxiliary subunit